MNLILQILTLLGSLGMFLYGMSLMSGGLQKMAGDRMRNFMASMTSTALKRVTTGIVVTALVQSSTATTLIIVSFVNAGLLSLANAIGVIMGANIGTTVTAWIFALSFGSSSFSFGTIAIPLMFFAFVLLSQKKKGTKNLGEFLMGFAFLFLGLTTLRETSTVLLDNEPVRVFLSHLTSYGFGSILIFMATGAVMTLMLQSSAATMAITMVLVANGYIPFQMAAAMVLGENIGTTITSNIAATVANVSAKRTARAHMLFNVFGVIWAVSLFHPFLNLIGGIVSAFGFPNPASTDFASADPMTKEALVASLPYSVATLHTLFNVTNTLILIWFVPVIEKIVTFLVPSNEGEEVFKLQYIHGEPLVTVELSLNEVCQEITHYGDICCKGFSYLRTAINEPDPEKIPDHYEELKKYEEITDREEVEIATYLGEVFKGEMSAHGKTFSPVLMRKMNHMLELVQRSYDVMMTNLNTPERELTDISNALDAEYSINEYRNNLREEHIVNLEKANYEYQTGSFYMDIVRELEKIGDFIINISQALVPEYNEY